MTHTRWPLMVLTVLMAVGLIGCAPSSFRGVSQQQADVLCAQYFPQGSKAGFVDSPVTVPCATRGADSAMLTNTVSVVDCTCDGTIKNNCYGVLPTVDEPNLRMAYCQ